MAISLEQFTQQLAATGLVADDELQTLREALPAARQADVQVFARELVRQKRLTAFQAQQLY